MQVWDVMTREVVAVGPQTSAEYTAEVMGERRRRAQLAGRRPRDRVPVGRPLVDRAEIRADGERRRVLHRAPCPVAVVPIGIDQEA